MILFPDIATVMVNALNRANVNTVVDPNSIVLVSSDDNGNINTSVVQLTIGGDANNKNYGTYTFSARRILLKDFFSDEYSGVGKTLSVPRVSTIKDLLAAIGYVNGFTFPDGIIDDGPVNWVNDAATVILNASPNNPYFASTTTLRLTVAPLKTMASLLTAMKLATVGRTLTKDGFRSRVSATNLFNLSEDFFDIGVPKTTAEAGVSLGTFNSVVRVTAKITSGYSGYVDVFYNRVDLSSFEGKSGFVPDGSNGNLYDVFDATTFDPTVDKVELLNNPIAWDADTKTCILEAKPDSYAVYGRATISFIPYSDDVHEITIDFTTSNSYPATYFASMVAAKIATAGILIVNLNIKPDIVVASTDLKLPALSFTAMKAYGEIRVKMKNEGVIVGQGSTSGQSTVNQPGGPGVNIDRDFNGTIEIDNLGIIGGGGGGGSSTSVYLNSTWYYVYGGGGRSLGQAATNNGVGNYPGYNGTMFAPGQQRNLTVQNTLLSSGPGGDVGEPGRFGYSMDLSTTPYVYLEERVSFPKVQTPGAAFTGDVSKVTFKNKGIVRPNIVSPLERFKAYLAEQGHPTYTDNILLSAVTDKTKPFIVETPISSFGPNGALNKPRGSAWGSFVSLNTSLAKVMVHAYPHLSAAAIGYLYGGLALIELAPQTTFRQPAAILRNNITAPAIVDSRGVVLTETGHAVTRFVYYDRYLDEVMECNPSLMTEPVKWVLKTKLEETDGELLGFK